MEMGLYVHQSGGSKVNDAANALNVACDYELVVVLVLGYRVNIQDLPENLCVREKAVRTRKPLVNIVFEGEFGKSFINNKEIVIS